MSEWLAGAADGALFLLQSALALAAVVASALVLWGLAVRQAVAAAVLFGAVALLTIWLPPLPINVLAPAVLVACGLLLATGWNAPLPLRTTAAAGGALAAGMAGGLQTATWPEAAGASLLLVASLLVLLLLARLVPVRAPWPRVVQLARRMAGAWIAAVGVLLLALTLRGIDPAGRQARSGLPDQASSYSGPAASLRSIA
jgi:hypothetical protein